MHLKAFGNLQVLLFNTSHMARFTFTTEEMELLSFFEESSSLVKTAAAYGRDVTIVSRMLKRISEKAPVLEKISGRWRLTEQGKQLCSLTRDTIYSQNALLLESKTLRIGTNREFLQKILLPDLDRLKAKLGNAQLQFKSYEVGTEKALLDGQIDLAIDCGPPYSPEVSFKSCVQEPMILVCHKDFYQKYKILFKKSRFEDIPHVYYERLKLDKHFSSIKSNNIALQFTDIVGARDACVLGYGWTLLPVYMIREPLKKKTLVNLSTHTMYEKYGVWSLKSRTFLANERQHLIDWLSQVSLDLN